MMNPLCVRGVTGGTEVVYACGMLKPVEISPGGTRHHSLMFY